ncbi:hypothetical protein PSMK_p00590 (plasmid) [Phycisphaera mikurensis NBRC 102666]|uniref:Uncharacterized protein n=1 Tax=Phycisphaera mikurensis (strain NBRC 102666 / KCTC 22515 / FYK2301M01) TaxID=1142394 RepID=I0IJI3_PHYMF|nr:hypothetical protein PSMK_p00590 [Phycisphaera mikurensis NBRC 102666]
MIPKCVDHWRGGGTVPQHAELDHYFGRTLDRELAKLVANGRQPLLSALANADRIRIQHETDDPCSSDVWAYPKGEMSPGKAAKAGAAVLQFHPDGESPLTFSIRASPMDLARLRRTEPLNLRLHAEGGVADLRLGGAALVRAAFLMWFRSDPMFAFCNNLRGWIVDPFVQAFQEDRRLEECGDLYDRFEGSVKVLSIKPNPRPEQVEALDSLKAGHYVMHTTTQRFPDLAPFAISALLRGSRHASLAITLPFATRPENREESLQLYRRYQTDPAWPHTRTFVRLEPGAFDVYTGLPGPDAERKSFRSGTKLAA